MKSVKYKIQRGGTAISLWQKLRREYRHKVAILLNEDIIALRNTIWYEIKNEISKI